MIDDEVFRYLRYKLYTPGVEVELVLPARATVYARKWTRQEEPYEFIVLDIPKGTRGFVNGTQKFKGETFRIIAQQMHIDFYTVPPLLDVLALGYSIMLFDTQIRPICSKDRPLYEIIINGVAQKVCCGKVSFAMRYWRWIFRGERWRKFSVDERKAK